MIFATNTPAVAGYSLRAFDTQGAEISSLTPGQMFELRMFATDLRSTLEPDEGGVFSAFADIVFSSSLVSAVGPVEVATLYGAAQSGSLAAPGLLDEVGGVDGITPLGTMPREVARVAMQAGSFTGVAMFATDFADETVQHPTLVFGAGEPIAKDMVDYGTLSLPINTENGIEPSNSLNSPPQDVPAVSSLAGEFTTELETTITEANSPPMVIQRVGFTTLPVKESEHSPQEAATDALFALFGDDLA
jgi:hypothetical protein